MAADLQIAPMVADDLEAVLEIEQHAFRSPWSRRLLLEELEREWAHLEVLREDGRIAGYINYWLVRDEVHLLNLAVHPEARRRGLGRALLRHLVDFAGTNQCRYLTLEVRRSNLPAIALYREVGFRPVGVRPRYYADDDEDAVVMLMELTEPAAPPPSDGG
jgi:ribosomal-protein-alanine N-acetyltransferase